MLGRVTRALRPALPRLQSVKDLHVGVLGAPFNKGQRKPGVTQGPEAIRATGVLQRLQQLGDEIQDYGDVTPAETTIEVKLGPDGERNLESVLEYNRMLAGRVQKVLTETELCVTIGGDHSISIGSVYGHAQHAKNKEVVILWVDAHSDINTGSTSDSGNMHGMPVAYLLRELADKMNRLYEWPHPCISASNIAYIGLRDVDPGEKDAMSKLGILNYSVDDVDVHGLNKVIDNCMKHLNPGPYRPLHLSFDIDALDPSEAPSTGTPVRGGLTLREGQQIVDAARMSGNLRAIDMVEVNPTLGSVTSAEHTADAAKYILITAINGFRGT
ncbi:unnamed protein product, partial [Meganyctiphanes norvegica]